MFLLFLQFVPLIYVFFRNFFVLSLSFGNQFLKIMKRLSIFLGIAAVIMAVSCTNGKAGYLGMEEVSFEFDEALFPNPERGFYTGTSFSNETETPLTPSALMANRAQNRTLFMVEFWLKDFFESDISDAYLKLIRDNLEAFRTSGVKCILRFGYSNRIKDLNNAEESGPFDATEEQVLKHIAQVKPILQEYADVIYVLQAGLVGCWGEWYYTTHFGMNPSEPDDYLPRKHVCDALLDALPQTRQVELRTPAFKMNLYGYTLADTLTRAEAHSGSLKARVAGHNDCILATENDEGTFVGPDDKAYWEAETRYTIMGGETCAMSSFCECDNTRKTMEAQHYSYLNLSYNRRVLSYWDENGCFDEIEARLGYRLSITDALFTRKPSGKLRAVLNIKNDGYASVMNPRDAEFVITDAGGKVVGTFPIDSDPRFWMPGTTTVIDQTIKLPEGLSGEYTLSLNLPDPCETLRDNPLFSIRLANKNVWEESTGFNRLYTFSL